MKKNRNWSLYWTRFQKRLFPDNANSDTLAEFFSWTVFITGCVLCFVALWAFCQLWAAVSVPVRVGIATSTLALFFTILVWKVCTTPHVSDKERPGDQ